MASGGVGAAIGGIASGISAPVVRAIDEISEVLQFLDRPYAQIDVAGLINSFTGEQTLPSGSLSLSPSILTTIAVPSIVLGFRRLMALRGNMTPGEWLAQYSILYNLTGLGAKSSNSAKSYYNQEGWQPGEVAYRWPKPGNIGGDPDRPIWKESERVLGV